MPACEGLPDRPCPQLKCDDTVVLGWGELMLCRGCDAERFRREKMANAKKQQQPVRTATKPPVTRSSSASAPAGGPSNSPDDATANPPGGVNHEVQEKIIINEVLSYISFYRNKATIESLRRIVLSSFTPIDISTAKKITVTRFQCHLLNSPLISDRRGSAARPAHEAEIDDIIGIMELLDASNAISQVSFVAANLDILPKYGPEELNVAEVVERQVRVEQSIKEISTIQQSQQTLFTDFQNKLDSFTLSVNASLEKLNQANFQALNRPKTPPPVVTQSPTVGRPVIDRSHNIIVFGIEENTDPTSWRQKVDSALEFLLGGKVDVQDMFRLGAFKVNKHRPILVKLRVAWDRRLLLMRSSQLKNYCIKGIFISPDESPEDRRQHTFERLQRKAEKEKKSVSVVNDKLFVDGVAIYSIVEGRISCDNNDDAV